MESRGNSLWEVRSPRMITEAVLERVTSTRIL
jgi:hypothetical protein